MQKVDVKKVVDSHTRYEFEALFRTEDGNMDTIRVVLERDSINDPWEKAFFSSHFEGAYFEVPVKLLKELGKLV